MKGFSEPKGWEARLLRWGEELRKTERERDYRVMRAYKGSPSFQAFQRRDYLKRLSARIPLMPEEKVIDLLMASDFKELPDDIKEAVANRMLELSNNHWND